MPKKISRVVRVVMNHDETHSVGTLIECLRYAGLVQVHRGQGDTTVFDIRAPHDVNDGVWAENNAKRMQSFYINAVDAPEASYGI
tara:strand:+ start:319 stop:573 length:255 start_codon:yes stop_codon:yes gene_type:complete